MSLEVDPLLPQNKPAPEITGYGFSRLSRSAEIKDYGTIEDDGEDPESVSEPATTRAALRPISTIFVAVLLFGLFFYITAHDGFRGPHPTPEPVPSRPARTIEERVSRILDSTPLIDGHIDLAIVIRYAYHNQLHTHSFRSDFSNGTMRLHVDRPRLRKGKVGGAFWSAFVSCPKNASESFDDSTYAEAVSQTFSQIDVLRRLQSHYPDLFTPAETSPAHALDMFQEKQSLISPLSIEGLHQIPPSAPLSTLRLYRALGVRAATLTWNCHNAFADAALISTTAGTVPAPYYRGGLTQAGRCVIREMNRLGILVDLSHTSYWTQKAVLSNNTSLAPVIYSHSSVFALCPHPRNVHDDLLDLVKATNSLVMINFSPDFISCLRPPNESVLPEFYDKNNTLHQVARHVRYIGDRIGYDHVGLGSDFDGMLSTPRGLEDVSKYPDLVAELLRLGIRDGDVRKVVGGNILRVWREAERVARRMGEEGVWEGEDEVTNPFAIAGQGL